MRMCIAALQEWKVDSTLVHELDVGVAPNPRLPITAARSQDTARGTQIDRDDRVLVSLKHALRRCGVRVPELDTTVLGP